MLKQILHEVICLSYEYKNEFRDTQYLIQADKETHKRDIKIIIHFTLFAILIVLHANTQQKQTLSLLFTPGLFIQNSHTNLHNYLHKASDHNVIEITPHCPLLSLFVPNKVSCL